MKKTVFILALLSLVATVAWATDLNSDKDFTAGLRAYNTKNYKAAIKHFTEYVNKKPDPTAYYLIGYSLYEQGKFTAAIESFNQAYLIDPEFSLEKVGLIKKAPDLNSE